MIIAERLVKEAADVDKNTSRVPLDTLEKAAWRLAELYFDDSVSADEYSGFRTAVAEIFWMDAKRVEDLARKKRQEISRLQEQSKSYSYSTGWGR
jgi:hypothetical protein